MGLMRVIFNLLFKVLLMVVLALLVAGAVERKRLFWLLGLMIVARGYFLWCEWRKPKNSENHWPRLEQEHTGEWRGQDGQTLADAESVSLDEAEAALVRPHARRADADIWSEALSLVITAPGAFLLALMLTSPVVSWAGSDRGPAALALTAGVAMHFLANLIPARRWTGRVMLRVVLMAGVLAPVFLVAQARHPYLLATGAAQRRMIAERVWHLGKTVQAGNYAGELVAYARDLEAERRWADARVVYERALSLDVYRMDAHEGLIRVLDALGEHGAAAEARRAALGSVETSGEPADEAHMVTPLPIFDWSEPARLRVCLVPVGEVPDVLLATAGRRMERVLGVEVFRWPEALPLPKADRKAAVLGAAQWQPGPLRRVLFDRLVEELARGRRASGAWQFILVTSGDLYMPDANYVFAVSFPVHGVVSFARFGADGDPRRAERLAKQLVATAIKGFGVGQAGRMDCVTAYVRSLGEHDRKPIFPAGPTLAEYRRRVELWERNPSSEPEAPR